MANVKEYDEESKTAVIEVRNHFEKGDRLAIMNPGVEDAVFTVEQMLDLQGNEVEIANRPMQLLRIKVPVAVNENTFIHLIREQL